MSAKPALDAAAITRRLKAAGIAVLRSRAIVGADAVTTVAVRVILSRGGAVAIDLDAARRLAVATLIQAGYEAAKGLDTDVVTVTLPEPTEDVVELDAASDRDPLAAKAEAEGLTDAEVARIPTDPRGRTGLVQMDYEGLDEGGRSLSKHLIGRRAAYRLYDGTRVVGVIESAQGLYPVMRLADDRTVRLGTYVELVDEPATDSTGAVAELDVAEVLAARRQAEAPAPTLPGVDAAIVEAELGGAAEDDDEVTLVVIPCSGAKLAQAAPAGELYTGSLHRAARAAADELAARTPGARVVILSALYGLLDPVTVVAPYDVTIGDAQAVTADVLADDLRAQLAATGARRVVALTPGRYTELLGYACDLVGAELVTPLAGSRGIGEQRGRLAAIRRGELAAL